MTQSSAGRAVAERTFPGLEESAAGAPARGWKFTAGLLLAGAVLFPLYMRLSVTYTENSDTANILLMANAMLHGNFLLHGWVMSDVSFYTTELPQYAVLESVFGLTTEVGHIAPALTYTLVVLLTVALAKGRAGGWPALIRILVAGGIMLAPQLGAGVLALDLSVGHIGTAVPLLAVWLLLDRARPRMSVAAGVSVLLAWVLVADRIVLVTAMAPVVVVCAVRVLPAVFVRDGRAVTSRLRPWRYELSLITAVGVACLIAAAAEAVLSLLGGYQQQPVPFALLPLRAIPANIALVFPKVLQIFAADPAGAHGVVFLLALLHLVSVALVALSLVLAGRRYLTGLALVDQVLAVSVVLNLAAYALTTAGGSAAHEVALVAPFGAALAARMLCQVIGRPAMAPPAGGRRAAACFLGLAVLAGYACGLGYEDTQPAQPAANAGLAAWLAAHGLTEGLSGYWSASSVTVASGNRVRVRALVTDGVLPEMWMTKPHWYDPRTNDPDFIVVDFNGGYYNYWAPLPQIRQQFGPPARIYHYANYEILVYGKNLLGDIPGSPAWWPDGQTP